ncbi:unnamed protein product, partial [Brassica rapa]
GQRLRVTSYYLTSQFKAIQKLWLHATATSQTNMTHATTTIK